MTWKHFPRTGPLWGESTGHQWISLKKGLRCGPLLVSLLVVWTNYWKKKAVEILYDLRCDDTHGTSLSNWMHILRVSCICSYLVCHFITRNYHNAISKYYPNEKIMKWCPTHMQVKGCLFVRDHSGYGLSQWAMQPMRDDTTMLSLIDWAHTQNDPWFFYKKVYMQVKGCLFGPLKNKIMSDLIVYFCDNKWFFFCYLSCCCKNVLHELILVLSCFTKHEFLSYHCWWCGAPYICCCSIYCF